MSQIFGIDFGSKNIVISVMKILPDSKVSPITVVEDSINNKKIEVTLSWDGSKLLFGDVASRQKTSKYKYTISCVNDLFGKKLSEVNEEIKEYHKPERIVKGDKEDRVGFDFNGNIITLDEIILLIFHEISEIIRNKVEIKSSEKLKSIFCVPSYWSEKEVNRFKTLCEKSEFECLEIIESYYSSVLCYGYENNNEFDEYSLKYILICDIGYMNNDYTLVGYSKNKFKILNHINGNKNDRYINGQKIDGLLLKEFKRRAENEGYEINDKCLIKLVKEIIKMKEKLSASGADEIQMIVELDDEKDDFVVDFSRNELNELLKKNGFDDCLRSNIEDLLKVLPTEMQNKIEPVIVGGCSRIPLLKSVLCSIVNKDALLYKSNYGGLIQTLNLDECNSEGCCVKYMIKNKDHLKGVDFKPNEGIDLKPKLIHQTSYDNSAIEELTDNVSRIIEKSEMQQQMSYLRNELEANIYHYQHRIEMIQKHLKNTDAIANQLLDELKTKAKSMNMNEISKLNKTIEVTLAPIDSIDNVLSCERFPELERKLSKLLIECRDLLDNKDMKEKEVFLEEIKRIEKWYIDEEKRTKDEYEDYIKKVEMLLTDIRHSVPKPLLYKHIQDKKITTDYIMNSPLVNEYSKHVSDFNDEIDNDITPSSTYEEMDSSIHKIENFNRSIKHLLNKNESNRIIADIIDELTSMKIAKGGTLDAWVNSLYDIHCNENELKLILGNIKKYKEMEKNNVPEEELIQFAKNYIFI